MLDLRSRSRLNGIHADLVRVVEAAHATGKIPFIVLEGLRTTQRQAELVAAGASRTMKSRHLTGHAVDLGVLVGGRLRWDWPLYEDLGRMVKGVASDLRVKLTWGGDWPTFRDGPHYQLDWVDYPA